MCFYKNLILFTFKNGVDFKLYTFKLIKSKFGFLNLLKFKLKINLDFNLSFHLLISMLFVIDTSKTIKTTTG